MTDIALRLDAAVAQQDRAPLFSRRLNALLRLIRIGRRRRTLAAHLDFADERVADDLGFGRSRHRHDWLAAFLAR